MNEHKESEERDPKKHRARLSGYMQFFDLVRILCHPMSDLAKDAGRGRILDELDKQGIKKRVVQTMHWIVGEYFELKGMQSVMSLLPSKKIGEAAEAIGVTQSFCTHFSSLYTTSGKSRERDLIERLKNDLEELASLAGSWQDGFKYLEATTPGKKGRPSNWRTAGAIVVFIESVAWQACAEGKGKADRIKHWAIDAVDVLHLGIEDLKGSRERALRGYIASDLPEEQQGNLSNANSMATGKHMSNWTSYAQIGDGFYRVKRANEKLVIGAADFYRRQDAKRTNRR